MKKADDQRESVTVWRERKLLELSAINVEVEISKNDGVSRSMVSFDTGDDGVNGVVGESRSIDDIVSASLSENSCHDVVGSLTMNSDDINIAGEGNIELR